MISRLRAYTRQNHLALIALMVAVIGVPTAWAIGKNTVGSKQLKPNAVKNSDVADDAVKSPEVADRSLQALDFAAGELPEGDKGDTGLTGPPGPTAAFAKSSTAEVPAAAPDLLSSPSKVITTPASGRLLVMFTSSGTTVIFDCTAGNPDFGLYVDGVPVPDTKRPMQDNVGKAIDIFGVTAAAVPAGNHTIQPGLDCPGGNANSTGFNDYSIGAILLGP